MIAHKNNAMLNYYRQIYLKAIAHLCSKVLLFTRQDGQKSVLPWAAVHMSSFDENLPMFLTGVPIDLLCEVVSGNPTGAI